MVEALETLDEFEDGEYNAYLEYNAFKDNYTGNYTTLYLYKNHEDYSLWKQYAEIDGYQVIQTEGETRLC